MTIIKPHPCLPGYYGIKFKLWMEQIQPTEPHESKLDYSNEFYETFGLEGFRYDPEFKIFKLVPPNYMRLHKKMEDKAKKLYHEKRDIHRAFTMHIIHVMISATFLKETHTSQTIFNRATDTLEELERRLK